MRERKIEEIEKKKNDGLTKPESFSYLINSIDPQRIKKSLINSPSLEASPKNKMKKMIEPTLT